jgi:excisionase family DNA binding protein
MSTDSGPKASPPDLEFLTVKQTAEYLNVSASIVYRLCVTGKLGHYRFGGGNGAIRVRRADLQEFVQRRKVEKKAEGPGAEGGRPRDRSGPKLVYARLDLRPKHTCGAVTNAGTPCTHRTRDRHCHQHHKADGARGE